MPHAPQRRWELDALRGLMQQLYPTSFESRSLGELIADVLPAAPWAGSLEVVVRDLLSEPVPLLEKAALYRVVVEALANVQKHARATVAVVELSCHGDVFAVRITDDGIVLDHSVEVGNLPDASSPPTAATARNASKTPCTTWVCAPS